MVMFECVEDEGVSRIYPTTSEGLRDMTKRYRAQSSSLTIEGQIVTFVADYGDCRIRESWRITALPRAV